LVAVTIRDQFVGGSDKAVAFIEAKHREAVAECKEYGCTKNRELESNERRHDGRERPA
jgi:hypothetical protein